MKISIADKLKKEFFSKHQLMLIVFTTLMGAFLLFAELSRDSSNKNNDESFSADTIIPKGFVLVPIELINLQSTSALVGKFAVVDLYLPNQDQPVKIASQVKMIRAPLNPNLFAVLVPENESQLILKATGPFIAIVQNPDKQTQTIFTKKQVSKSRIQYQQGGI